MQLNIQQRKQVLHLKNALMHMIFILTYIRLSTCNFQFCSYLTGRQKPIGFSFSGVDSLTHSSVQFYQIPLLIIPTGHSQLTIFQTQQIQPFSVVLKIALNSSPNYIRDPQNSPKYSNHQIAFNYCRTIKEELQKEENP